VSRRIAGLRGRTQAAVPAATVAAANFTGAVG
jgi:hypothetical protein